MYRNPAEWRACLCDISAITEYQKVRRIDPLFISADGTNKRLSDVDSDYSEYIKSIPKYKEYKILKKKLNEANSDESPNKGIFLSFIFFVFNFAIARDFIVVAFE